MVESGGEGEGWQNVKEVRKEGGPMHGGSEGPQMVIFSSLCSGRPFKGLTKMLIWF